MAKSVPDPIFPDDIWDGTTPKWPNINTDKTPDVEIGARHRAEIRSLEAVLDSYSDMLDVIAAYGAANTMLGVKGDGTALEYKTLVAGTGIAIVHSGTDITINSTVVSLPAGADTQVQYNDGGAFGADAGFTTDKAGSITLSGTVTVNADNEKLLLGASQDAAIYYDGSNLIIDPSEVGNGGVEIPISASQQKGIYIDGTTVPYAGGTNWGLQLQKTIATNTGPGNQNLDAFGLSFIVQNNREVEWVNKIASSSIDTYGIQGSVGSFADHEAALTVTEQLYGGQYSVQRQQNSTGVLATQTTYIVGNDVSINENVDTDGGTYVLNAYGNKVQITSGGTENSGTAVKTLYGTHISVSGTASGATTNYGIYINSVLGAVTNWSIWDASGADWVLDADDQKIFLGAAQDASVYFDGADFVFDSQEAGSGNFNFKSGTIEVEGIQTIYNADALGGFTGTLVVGNGGANLSHVAGNDAYYNTVVGLGAGRDNTTGAFNAALGGFAMDKNTSGINNTAVGYYSLRTNTTGNNNTGVGHKTLWSNTVGVQNFAGGVNALYTNTSGDGNVAIGYQALYFGNTVDFNTGVGYSSLYNATDECNTGMGAFALYDTTSGTYNTALGCNTGRGITTGDYNTIIGAQVTGLAAGLSNHVIIADGQGNQRIVVDNNGDAEINGDLKIDGKFSTGATTISAAGPTDNVDVGACNIVFLDTSSNSVTIGGFVNGVVNQIIRVVRLDSTNDATLEYNEGTGNQDIFLANEADHTISTYGGWTLVCNGTHWYEVGY